MRRFCIWVSDMGFSLVSLIRMSRGALAVLSSQRKGISKLNSVLNKIEFHNVGSDKATARQCRQTHVNHRRHKRTLSGDVVDQTTWWKMCVKTSGGKSLILKIRLKVTL